MKSWENYNNLTVTTTMVNEIKRKYSVTADVLSYRRCPRLYASLAVRGFSPAQPSQRYVGSIIHQVLDRAHLHYAGKIDPQTKGKIPSEEDIESYFEKVENALRAHGIRPFSPNLSDYVLGVLKKFNEIEGNELYPRVIDTEHRLQSDRGNYILHGVVDVLVSGHENPTSQESVEIWDYKGTKRPKQSTKFGNRILEDYTFQMQVYASLYNSRNGHYPVKGVIYFLGELSEENINSRPPEAVLEVPVDPPEMNKALSSFDRTVQDIETSREKDEWNPPEGGHETAGKETCDACDLRFSCPKERERYPPRYP